MSDDALVLALAEAPATAPRLLAVPAVAALASALAQHRRVAATVGEAGAVLRAASADAADARRAADDAEVNFEMGTAPPGDVADAKRRADDLAISVADLERRSTTLARALDNAAAAVAAARPDARAAFRDAARALQERRVEELNHRLSAMRPDIGVVVACGDMLGEPAWHIVAQGIPATFDAATAAFGPARVSLEPVTDPDDPDLADLLEVQALLTEAERTAEAAPRR